MNFLHVHVHVDEHNTTKQNKGGKIAYYRPPQDNN